VRFYVGAHGKAHLKPAQIHPLALSRRWRSDGLRWTKTHIYKQTSNPN
jgi:hypothetical protein